MKPLIALLCAAALAACAPATPPPSARSDATVGLHAEATLATVGTVEHELAPLLTRNAVIRSTAARALQAGRIDAATAAEVQRLADAARAGIERARTADAPERARLVTDIRALQAQAWTLTEKTQ